jgi:hypothetical protein
MTLSQNLRALHSLGADIPNILYHQALNLERTNYDLEERHEEDYTEMKKLRHMLSDCSNQLAICEAAIRAHREVMFSTGDNHDPADITLWSVLPAEVVE